MRRKSILCQAITVQRQIAQNHAARWCETHILLVLSCPAEQWAKPACHQSHTRGLLPQPSSCQVPSSPKLSPSLDPPRARLVLGPKQAMGCVAWQILNSLTKPKVRPPIRPRVDLQATADIGAHLTTTERKPYRAMPCASNHPHTWPAIE